MNRQFKLILIILCYMSSIFADNAVVKLAKNVTGVGDGVVWPSPRFATDSSGSCIIDNLTGLMWPKNGLIGFEATQGGGPIAQPNYNNSTANLNTLTYLQSLTAMTNLNAAANKLCGYSDWRLPNVTETLSLFNYSLASQANWLKYGTGSSGAPSCDGACFTNMASASYWTSTSRPGNNVLIAWMAAGFYSLSLTTGAGQNNIIPVRGGN